jgi:2-phosphosulfolactate phosphatase
MKVNVHFSNLHIDELYYTGKTSVVIDVLRASTVIVEAVTNGAREIIPVNSVDFAMKISGNTFAGQTILGGERNTKIIEGFAIGNSPIEYKPEVVAGKTIVLYTTNGSKTILKAKFSVNLFICSFTNLLAVAKHLVTLGHDVEINCAGSNGNFNLEDAICAGRLITEMILIDDSIEISDSGQASVNLNKSFGKNILKMLKNTEHGKLLIENGFLADIKECAEFGTSDVIPYYVSGSIKKLETETAHNINESEVS